MFKSSVIYILKLNIQRDNQRGEDIRPVLRTLGYTEETTIRWEVSNEAIMISSCTGGIA